MGRVDTQLSTLRSKQVARWNRGDDSSWHASGKIDGAPGIPTPSRTKLGPEGVFLSKAISDLGVKGWGRN